MELIEVMSPSVAVPVLCVLVCAFLVFAFGFKSPAQPPSFDVFDDDGKKKRTKKSKGSKGQSNGHAVVSGDSDVNNSAKPQPSPRQTVKQSTKTQSATAAKSKSAPQVTQESKKTKKQSAKEEEVKPKAKVEEIEDDFDAGWNIVPKKDKKQKKKEADSKQDKRDVSPVKLEEIVAKADDGVAAAGEVEAPGTPQEQRNKKKKDKKAKKVKQEEETMVQIKPEPQVVPVPVVETPAVVVKEKETTPDIELQIKEAMETNVEETISAEKKKKNKNKKKALPTPEEDDFVIPNTAMITEAASVGAESVDNTPLKENTEALTVKVSKKKQKKDRNKKNEEGTSVSTESGASASTDSSLSKPVSESQPKKTSKQATETKPSVDQSSSGVEAAASSDTVSAPTSSVPVFDELGAMTESWTEAKPKSKKKKARRAD